MSPVADPGATIFSAYDKYRRKRSGGKSKTPRIQVPGTKTGGLRIYIPAKGWPRVWHPGQRLSSSPINNIVKARYVRNNNDSRRHVNDWLGYIQEREKAYEEPERKFFNRERSQIDRDDVKEELLTNQGKDIAFYKLLLSPKQNELDHEAYTREIMTRWEELTGIKTNWYAIKHSNTEHHHVHIVMPGLDVDGNPYRLDRDQLNLMREIANEYQYELQDRAYDYEKAIDYELGVSRDQMEKYLERREGDELMKELGVSSKELEETIKELLPPTNFDDLEFRRSLENRSENIDRNEPKESEQPLPTQNDVIEKLEVDYLSPMEWTEHFADQDAKESCDRESALSQERERDDREGGELL
jgi:hypothetical protein